MQPYNSFPPLDSLYLVELSRKGGRLVRRTVVCTRSFAMDVASAAPWQTPCNPSNPPNRLVLNEYPALSTHPFVLPIQLQPQSDAYHFGDQRVGRRILVHLVGS